MNESFRLDAQREEECKDIGQGQKDENSKDSKIEEFNIKRNTKGRQPGKKGNPALGMNLEQNLPLAGSGKMPWLRLLITEDLGES